MTDTYPGFSVEYPSSDRFARRLHWLLAVRVILALAGIGLVFFILRWSSAIKEEDAPRSQIHEVRSEGEIVVPDYRGTGRGSTTLELEAWRFGTVEEHPFWFAGCVAVLVWTACAFAACKLYAWRLKQAAEEKDQLVPEELPPETS
jgi:GNAT superfamily N-acetyltransferase